MRARGSLSSSDTSSNSDHSDGRSKRNPFVLRRIIASTILDRVQDIIPYSSRPSNLRLRYFTTSRALANVFLAILNLLQCWHTSPRTRLEGPWS